MNQTHQTPRPSPESPVKSPVAIMYRSTAMIESTRGNESRALGRASNANPRRSSGVVPDQSMKRA